jgi:predicted nucleic acid-binding protein
MVFVDSNIFFDMWDHDPVWEPWSRPHFLAISNVDDLGIDTVVYAELSTRYSSHSKLDRDLQALEIRVLATPQEAAFLAGKAFQAYRAKGGTKTGALADFFIGAHAYFLGASLLTRDPRPYRTYFPAVHLITP